MKAEQQRRLCLQSIKDPILHVENHEIEKRSNCC